MIKNLLFKIPYEIIKAALMRPAAFRLSENEKAWGSKGKIFRLAIPNTTKQICVWEYGVGPTIILMHGWAGRGLQLSPLIQPVLNLGYKVALFDAPGHGDSDGIGSTYLEFVTSLALVAAHYPDLQGVVAHSMGCGATIVLASKMARADFKTVLIAPHYDMKTEFEAWARSAGLLHYALDAFIRISEIRFAYKLDDINPKNLTHLQKGPFLLFHDVDDRASKFQNSELLNHDLPNSQLIKTSGKGHNRILKDAEVLKKISAFLAPANQS